MRNKTDFFSKSLNFSFLYIFRPGAIKDKTMRSRFSDSNNYRSINAIGFYLEFIKAGKGIAFLVFVWAWNFVKKTSWRIVQRTWVWLNKTKCCVDKDFFVNFLIQYGQNWFQSDIIKSNFYPFTSSSVGIEASNKKLWSLLSDILVGKVYPIVDTWGNFISSISTISS